MTSRERGRGGGVEVFCWLRLVRQRKSSLFIEFFFKWVLIFIRKNREAWNCSLPGALVPRRLKSICRVPCSALMVLGLMPSESTEDPSAMTVWPACVPRGCLAVLDPVQVLWSRARACQADWFHQEVSTWDRESLLMVICRGDVHACGTKLNSAQNKGYVF